ncbi:HNH endonuclease [Sphingomonas oligophenolica]|uniref:HNH endonuclease n=1 Tax=Sphingomonas oligophenolica TaxID=301154 RepID=A0A502BU05_9SPHN|nr:HNH endonuclease [Sphingomonas oligophenolica]
MPNTRKILDVCFNSQSGRCHYCRTPMWRGSPADFATVHAISLASAGQLQATAEHLIPRSEGGPNTAANIVAACRYCNTHRHKARAALLPEMYLRKVRKRLLSGKWHRMLLTSVESG